MPGLTSIGPRAASPFSAQAEARQIFPENAWQGLAPRRLQEIRSLSRERDPEMFFEGLLSLAGRMEQAGELEGAVRVYSAMAAPDLGPRLDRSVRNRAVQRLDAIRGVGAFGPRAEFLLRRLSEEALDPAPLVGMGLAAGAFRLTRFMTLSRLASGSQAGWWSRGIGAKHAASLFAFGAEAVAFPLGTRLAATAMGRDPGWNSNQVGGELASSFLVLGAMRLTGWGTSLVARDSWVGGRGTLRQLGMLGGILAGHRLEQAAGLRPQLDGATTLTDSLALLLQFNVAGRLMHHALGPKFAQWERRLESSLQRATTVRGPVPISEGFAAATAYASSPQGPRPFLAENFSRPLRMSSLEKGGGIFQPPSPSAGRPPEGRLVPRGSPGLGMAPFSRAQAGIRLHELMPGGRVQVDRLEDPAYVGGILKSFAVTSHSFDIASFRAGFEIAKNFPERVRELAFDVDEVYLHWSLSLRDLFRGIFSGGKDPHYSHTPPELLRYEPFRNSPEGKLSLIERLWFQGVQRLFQGRMRQNIQLHPGVRAFQLGLKFGQGHNLVMATTGPAGRILILANEDPAMRMIYFGKGPEESLTIQEIREAPNVYTREHLVMAMREVLEGTHRYPEDPMVLDFLERVRRFPKRGVKLKHPAIATLLGKRPFTALVDDSASTLEMLGDLKNFAVLQPPSARPKGTLNFVLLRPGAYLRRMSSDYVQALAEALAVPDTLVSQSLPKGRPMPAGYPHQRLAIEIPWQRFAREYVAPGRELRALGQQVAQLHLPTTTQGSSLKERPHFSEPALRALAGRLKTELDLWTEGTRAKGAVEAGLAGPLQDMARVFPENFTRVLSTYLTEAELARIPEMDKPPRERSEQFFSRVASLIAAKRAALGLLRLPLEKHAVELEFRFGRPFVSGAVRDALAGRVLQLSMARDGNAGVGVALLEGSVWESGLVRIGLDVTNGRVRYTTPLQHALAEAAHKAVFQGYGPGDPRQFHADRAGEIRRGADGRYYLSGRMAAAARALRGEGETRDPLEVRAFHFRTGPDSVVALVGIPAHPVGKPPPPSLPPPSRPPPLPEGPARGGHGIIQGGKSSEVNWDAWAREVEAFPWRVQGEVAEGEIPEYPLSQDLRPLVGAGFFFNREILEKNPTTLQAIESEYRRRFSDRNFFQIKEERSKEGLGQRTLSWGPEGDRLAVRLREISWEGARLLHIQEAHEFGGVEIPMHEEVRFLESLQKGSRIQTEEMGSVSDLLSGRVTGPDFPYRVGEDGRYHLPRPGMKVAVLGDVGGHRAGNLAAQGHEVIYIDLDPEMLEISREEARFIHSTAGAQGKNGPEFRVQFLEGDWYQTEARADLVEAYFPLNALDIPSPKHPQRREALREFLSRALNSKILPGGAGFVISERFDMIVDLARVISEDPSLELLEVRIDVPHREIPLVGGYSSMQVGFRQNSFLVYRRIR